MWAYAFVLTIVGSLAFLSLYLSEVTRSARAVCLASTFLVLFVFIGLRDRVGADWDTYQAIFDVSGDMHLSDAAITIQTEPGYALLNFFVQSIGGSIHLVNLVCAVIMLVGLVKFADLIDVDPTLLLFLATPYLLFVIGMCFTRQAVAIGIGCAALGYWVHGHRKKSLLLIALAVSFHYSAVFLLALIWMKSWKRVLIGIALITVAGYLFLSIGFGRYFELYVENTQDLQASGVWFRLAIVLIGTCVAALQRKRFAREPAFFWLIVGASVVAICLLPVAAVASTIANRVCFYLLFVYLAGLARAIRFSRMEAHFLALLGGYAATYACFFLWFSASSYATEWWIPYHSVLLSGMGIR